MNKLPKHTVVWLLRNFDSKGTVAATECVVDSWGDKQIHLRETANGKTLKHRGIWCYLFYTPQINQYPSGFHILAAEGLNVTEASLALAAQYLTAERAHLARCLQSSEDPGYLKAIADHIAALHEPRAVRMQAGRVQP
jgi:hypothetical protein